MTSPNNIPEGNSLEDQQAFLRLSKVEQVAIVESNHRIATILNGPKTIEIAGYKILGMPLESIGFTPEQQKKFEEAGGLVNPSVDECLLDENKDKMMYWTDSFEECFSSIDNGPSYKGFDLFKKVYEGFPEIEKLREKEAREAGLYPTIHYRNFAANKWMAEMIGGHLATLDKDYNGELRDIYNAAPGYTNLQKLAAMGQALLGEYYIDDLGRGLGRYLGWTSGSLHNDGEHVCSLVLRNDKVDLINSWYTSNQYYSISGVVVLDK